MLADGDEFAAALAVATRQVPHRLLPIARELRFATDPLADYQGMLARPSHEHAAIASFAGVLASAPWDRLALRDAQDPRIEQLAELLAVGPRVRLRRIGTSICYQMDLPETYETYLTGLSRKTRRATRHLLPEMEAELPGVRVTLATDADIDEHIAAVVGMNSARWKTSTIRRLRLEALYRAVYAEGIGRFMAIWDGQRAIAAGAAWVDEPTATYGFALGAHDPSYNHLSPGRTVLTLLIQDAIALGCRTFDFLRGEDEYKRRYATRTSLNSGFELVRAGARESALRAVMPVYDAAKTAFIRVAMRAR